MVAWLSTLTAYNWLCLLGVPSIIGTVCKVFGAKFKKQKIEVDAIKRGQQALLRDRLYLSYQFCVNKGYTELWERQNFINMYENYHALGVNGVMEDIKKRFLELPDEAVFKKNKEEKKHD